MNVFLCFSCFNLKSMPLNILKIMKGSPITEYYDMICGSLKETKFSLWLLISFSFLQPQMWSWNGTLWLASAKRMRSFPFGCNVQNCMWSWAMSIIGPLYVYSSYHKLWKKENTWSGGHLHKSAWCVFTKHWNADQFVAKFVLIYFGIR